MSTYRTREKEWRDAHSDEFDGSGIGMSDADMQAHVRGMWLMFIVPCAGLVFVAACVVAVIAGSRL